MNDGFISLWRKITETSFYKNPNACHLAIHLLLKANWKENKIIFNNQELLIKRGQHLSGRKILSKETGLSEQEVRTSVNILENVNFLTKKATNQFTIYSISNYDFYQIQPTNTLTSNQPTDSQPITTPNKDYKDEKDNKNINVETQKVYDFYLLKFYKNPNLYKLTDKRKLKIQSRLSDAGIDLLLKAIEKTASSKFYRGDNDRGWQADLDFIIKSYEQVEKLANLEGNADERKTVESDEFMNKITGGQYGRKMDMGM